MIASPKKLMNGVDQKFWVKRKWLARRVDHFERAGLSQKISEIVNV